MLLLRNCKTSNFFCFSLFYHTNEKNPNTTKASVNHNIHVTAVEIIQRNENW